VRLQDLRTGAALDFETWVAAWAYVDEAMQRTNATDDDGPAAGSR
jgi:hypothetical protein